MDEELNVDPKYKQAFNNGYLVAMHQPDLFKDMPANMNDPYAGALLAGKQQYEKDKARDYFKQFDRGDNKDRDKDKDINR